MTKSQRLRKSLITIILGLFFCLSVVLFAGCAKEQDPGNNQEPTVPPTDSSQPVVPPTDSSQPSEPETPVATKLTNVEVKSVLREVVSSLANGETEVSESSEIGATSSLGLSYEQYYEELVIDLGSGTSSNTANIVGLIDYSYGNELDWAKQIAESSNFEQGQIYCVNEITPKILISIDSNDNVIEILIAYINEDSTNYSGFRGAYTNIMIYATEDCHDWSKIVTYHSSNEYADTRIEYYELVNSETGIVYGNEVYWEQSRLWVASYEYTKNRKLNASVALTETDETNLINKYLKNAQGVSLADAIKKLFIIIDVDF